MAMALRKLRAVLRRKRQLERAAVWLIVKTVNGSTEEAATGRTRRAIFFTMIHSLHPRIKHKFYSYASVRWWRSKMINSSNSPHRGFIQHHNAT